MDLEHVSSIPGINHAPMFDGFTHGMQGTCRTLMWHHPKHVPGQVQIPMHPNAGIPFPLEGLQVFESGRS
eukprot:2807404-Amphidinium_carterae.1